MADLATRVGVESFRGSEADVMGRVVGAAEASCADVVVEVTADCPLIIRRRGQHELARPPHWLVDYVANVLDRTYPVGLDTQVFTTEALQRAYEFTHDPGDREHVSQFMYHHPELFSLCNVASTLPERFQHLRLTVDVEPDLTLIQSIYGALYPDNPHFTTDDVLSYLDGHPTLYRINGSGGGRTAVMPLRAAVIGCGVIGAGDGSHAEAYATISCTRLAAVCDTHPGRRTKAARRWEARRGRHHRRTS